MSEYVPWNNLLKFLFLNEQIDAHHTLTIYDFYFFSRQNPGNTIYYKCLFKR